MSVHIILQYNFVLLMTIFQFAFLFQNIEFHANMHIAHIAVALYNGFS